MDIQDIRLMYEYNYWANKLLLDKAAKVTPEQYLAPSTHSFVNLRGTLVHTLDAEWSWRMALQGQGFQDELKAADFPTVDGLRERWLEEEQTMWSYLDSLSNSDLTTIIRYPVDGGVIRERILWNCLYHVVNHGMQHRSESANLLTVYEQSPGDLDFTVFLNARNAKQMQA